MDITPNYISVDHCRICGSKNIVDLNVAKNFYLLNLDLSIDMPYMACADCEFIFQGRYVGDDFLSTYYNKSPMLRRKTPNRYEIDQIERQANFVTRNIDIAKKRVLEIGSSTGFFLKYLHQKYSVDIYFDELSEEAVEILEEQSEFKNFHKFDVKIDLIVLRHVLEHIYDLDSFLSHIDKITESKSMVFVEVPDWSHLDGDTDPLNFEHINQFNSGNVIDLFSRKGWSCEALEKSICATDPASPNRVQRFIFKKLNYFSDIEPRFNQFMRLHHDRLNNSINEVLDNIDENESIALYPASHLTFSALRESNLKNANVVGFFDIDRKKHGKTLDDIEIFPAEDIVSINPNIVILLTMGYEAEIIRSLKSMGVKSKILPVSELLDKN